MMGWEQMTSAPKNENILIANNTGEIHVGFFDDLQQCWKIFGTNTYIWYPYRWMRVPKPPQRVKRSA